MVRRIGQVDFGPVAIKKAGPRLSIIPAAAVTDERLDGTGLRVLLLLGRHTDRMGWCRRSQTTMAEELRCSRSTIQRGIGQIVNAGYVEKRLGSKSRRSHAPLKQPCAAYHYRVILDPPDAVDCYASDVPADGQVATDAPAGGHPVPTMPEHPYERSSANGIKQETGLEAPSWGGLEARLVDVIGLKDFRAWFAKSEILQEKPFRLMVRSPGAKRCIVDRYHELLIRLYGTDYRIEIAGPCHPPLACAAP